MTTDQVYKVLQIIINKNQQGNLTPDQFYLLINTAQSQYLDYLLGEYQRQQVGRSIPVVSFGQNQKLRTSLAPLIYGTILNPNSSTGIASFPSDFELVDAMWSLYGIYNIRFATQDKLNSYYRSSIDPIADNPVFLIQQEGFHFYPESIGQVRMSYVRTPPSIVWAYTFDGNGRPVYDPANSQQPVWSDTDIFQIIIRAAAIEGVSLQLNTVIGYANDIKNNGQ